jgi:hypothetical protein
LLVYRRQLFESFEEFDRMLAHTFKLTVFLKGSKAASSLDTGTDAFAACGEAENLDLRHMAQFRMSGIPCANPMPNQAEVSPKQFGR